jgi:Tol biopolymer transport system component
VFASLIVTVAPPREASATYPGENGRIVFPSASHGGLWTLGPDGTGPVQLAPGDYPEYSPDGTRIVSQRGSAEIWVMRADGTNQRPLPTDAAGCSFVSGVTWSPDGRRVAFSKQCGNDYNIFVTNVDGTGQPSRLTTHDGSWPAWSPDGTKIAFEAESDIWVMNADGSNPVQLTNDGDNRVVNWAPDSARLIFGRDAPGDTGRRIYVMNANGTGITALTPDDPVHDGDPVFSPDGTRFAFIEDEHIQLANADGTNVTTVAPVVGGTPLRAYAPDWGICTGSGCSPPPPGDGMEFSSATYDGSESDGGTRLLSGALITVVRTDGATGPASVAFATTDGTAKSSRTRSCRACDLAPLDYLRATGLLYFADGEVSKTFRVPIIDDGVIESDETVNLTLRPVRRGAPLGAVSTAVLTIHDNDPNISFRTSSSRQPEDSDAAPPAVVLSAPVPNATVNYAVVGGTATPGQDYTLPAGTVAFRGRNGAIPLRVLDDNLKEEAETIIVELSAPSKAALGRNPVHTFTIERNDPNGDVAGDTAATAMDVDLVRQPRQFQGETLAPSDIDMYRVHLEAEDDLAIDVDGVGPVGTALRSSTLTILGSDGTTELAVVNGSEEPDGRGVTPNPAELFHAPADGDYYLRLSNGFGRYRMELHRLALAEGLQDPRVLDQEGPMFVWLRGDTLAITGPTGYGFTLQGPWTETSSAPLPNGTRNTVYRLRTRDEVDVATAFGELRVQALENITVTTTPNRWGDVFGAVSTEEIPLPMSIPLDALQDEFRALFGLDMTVSALERWTITMGRDILGTQRGRPAGIGELLPGVPYLLFYDRPAIAASFGPVRINKNALDDKILLILDPVDPSLYIRADEVSGVKDPILVFSTNGYIPFHAELPPTIPEAVGVTDFYSHVFASGGISPLPGIGKYITLTADGSVDADANDDGTLLAGEGNAHQLFNGDLSAAEPVFRDINLGANAKAVFLFEWGPIDFETPLGRASAVYNGQQERLWFRGSRGAERSPLANTPFRFLDMTQQDFIEGTIRSDGQFHVLGGTRLDLPGNGELLIQLDVDNQGIAANVGGDIELEGSYQGNGCKATAGARGLFAFSYDNRLHVAGSLEADGRVTCKAGGATVATKKFKIGGRFDDGRVFFRLPLIGEKSIRIIPN